jgi:hypothetical protein
MRSPTRITGDYLRFGIGSVVPITMATGRLGKPVQTGHGSISIVILPGRSYQPVGAARSLPVGELQAVSRRK